MRIPTTTGRRIVCTNLVRVRWVPDSVFARRMNGRFTVIMRRHSSHPAMQYSRHFDTIAGVHIYLSDVYGLLLHERHPG